MLCAGLVHGDLSEYNVLVGSDGLVIIDLPQAVDAAGNNNAGRMLERDVANMTAYFGRFAPELLATDYGREIWKLYATGELSPATDTDRPLRAERQTGRRAVASCGISTRRGAGMSVIRDSREGMVGFIIY